MTESLLYVIYLRIPTEFEFAIGFQLLNSPEMIRLNSFRNQRPQPRGEFSWVPAIDLPTSAIDMELALPTQKRSYPLAICYIAIEHGQRKFVSFPMNNGESFHSRRLPEASHL